jgi:hypothetical protein
MTLSREARLMAGLTLVTVPAVIYGGVSLLGLLTQRAAGFALGDIAPDQTQWALFRAGHAHAGVWLIFSLVIQALLDSAVLSPKLKWVARIAAPVAAISVSAGFFGFAFSSGFQALIYFGGATLALAALLTGIGLLRKQNAPARRTD